MLAIRAKSEMSGVIYQLKITLAGLEPEIWRRVEVPGDYTLDKLHGVIQAAMDWEDYHLWAFYIGDAEYMPSVPGDFSFDFGSQPQNPKNVTLEEALGGRKIKFRYVYDMGDDWLHEIKVEKIVAPQESVVYPRCSAGEHGCPPEDCGGPWGYADMLEILSEPEHEDYGRTLEWLGGEFDPEAFNLDAINRELIRRFKKRAKKKSS